MSVHEELRGLFIELGLHSTGIPAGFRGPEWSDLVGERYHRAMALVRQVAELEKREPLLKRGPPNAYAMAVPITDRQTAILMFVHSYIKEHGYSPSVREMGAGIGVTSMNSVVDHLRALEKKGYVSRPEKINRSVRVMALPLDVEVS
jgi:hypothetical protein